jgi:CheY-like chemotaxis protein
VVTQFIYGLDDKKRLVEKMAKIMVVDDDPKMLFLVKRILKNAGHRVVGTSGGKEALKRLNGAKPDLILLDIMMPFMDGWETLKRIRARNGFNKIPVSMLTAVSLTPEILRINDVDELVDYIQKPLTRTSLINKVNNILENLQRISNQKSKLDSGNDKSTLEEYQNIAKKKLLHESITTTLKNNLKKIPNSNEAKLTKEAISSEQNKIDQLLKKKEEIEIMVDDEKSSSNWS